MYIPYIFGYIFFTNKVPYYSGLPPNQGNQGIQGQSGNFMFNLGKSGKRDILKNQGKSGKF